MNDESIKKISSLICFDEAMKEKLKSYSINHLFNKDDFVFQASTPKKYFYILLSGRVKLYRVSSVGKEVTQWFCFPGEVFGIADVLPVQTGPESVYAQCCEASEVVAIPLSQFNEFITHSPDLAIQIIEQLSIRLKIVGDTLLNFTSDNVKTRLVKLITRLSMRFGVEYKKGVLINVVLTHKEIADMMGTCRQSVTTALGELKSDGYIKIIEQQIFVPSVLKFEKLVDASNAEPLEKNYERKPSMA